MNDNTTINSLNTISIKGAKEHNLKSVSVEIPKNKLVVFTGLSGSGKSSLAFDTLYAEGQRRYVESLSSYARQFLGVMSKPKVDQITGLSPAISIDQKTTSHNPRSTVGTITEIYDYLRLLYARIGHPHCPNCGKEVASQSIDQVVDQVYEKIVEHASYAPARCMILSPVIREKKGEFQQLFENLQKKGYQKARIDGSFYNLSDDISLIKTNKHSVDVVIDRLVISSTQLKDSKEQKTIRSRLTQSIEESLKLADGLAIVTFIQDNSLTFPENPKEYTDHLYSEKRACTDCGISLDEIEPRTFSFNSPQGACLECNGLGTLLKVDKDKVVAPTLTLSEGAIIPFARTISQDTWWSRLIQTVIEEAGYDFRKTAFEDLDSKTQEILLYGSKKLYTVKGVNRQGRETTIKQAFEGFINNLERRYLETESDFIRKDIEQFMQKQICPSCNGSRLTPEALSVFVDGKNIAEITQLPINTTEHWVSELLNQQTISEKEKIIASSIIKEIKSRLSFLVSVGLNYLTLSREASTLAGGEAQRIRLASQIGTGLTGVLYILDEPTIGLHPRDNQRLITTLKELQSKGNSVIVVEHDRDVMLSAHEIIDFGPKAGKHGGKIIAQGSPQELMSNPHSVTADYLKRKKDVLRPKKNRKRLISEETSIQTRSIKISGAHHHNLKYVDVHFPLQKLVAITGVSGSGKSTLLHDTLYAHLKKNLGRSQHLIPAPIEAITIPDDIKRVTLIDQNPIGKTPRSNPATYTKVFDYVRKVFASTKDAHIRGYNQGRFSFNVKGGRCESCQGDGQIKIEMQFLPDVYVECDVCHGQRYNQETLEVYYKGKNISEVLHMSINEAAEFFRSHSAIYKKLTTLQEVGLGYLELGQPAPTLSGGEAQRVKLARELSTTRIHEHVVYLLDEPTTGLHFEDIQKLLLVLDRLVEQNNTVIVIEHNLDIIKNADWIIDLGPEGGDGGGEVVAEGTPMQLASHANSETGKFLREEFEAMGVKTG